MNVREAISTFRGHRVPHLNLIAHRKWWFALSGFFIVLSLAGLFIRGLNFSIEFKGGSLLEFPNRSGASVRDYQAIMSRFGLGDAKVEIVGSRTVDIKTKSLTQLGLTPATPSPTPTATPSPTASGATPTPTASATPTPTATPTASASGSPSPTASPATGSSLRGDQLRTALARTAGISVNEINEQDVGPTWGSTISRKMFTALVVFLLLVSLYITLRFEVKMAAGALIALGHDLIITAGIYALVGREVTPETVIAILTILGYSLYDTVVIYDKVKENTESAAMVARDTYSGVVNTSLNQTLMRSVNTSLVVLLPIGALLLFGGQTLKDFAFALFIGVATGAYSSIFIAAPVLALFKEREPRYQQIRARAAARAARPGLRAATPRRVAAAPEAEEEMELEPATLTAVPSRGSGASGARARPAGKKKKGKAGSKSKRRRR
ncbi:MAG TPA: protein translocase subunit SecF [Actinomycetota bacterium]|nr:protein translocase subunit SecF [Actinomycetota bacterium]